MSKETSTSKLGPIVAIDGPAGTGKSTVTRRLSDELSFTHIDTGALYRAVALAALELRIVEAQDKQISDPDGVTEVARNTDIRFRYEESANKVFINGTDRSSDIRTETVSKFASLVSAVPGVRAALLGLQRKLGSAGNTILEGRDIGTVVFPDADVKVFLTASVEERANRRWKELQAKGELVDLAEVRKKIEARDHSDSTRKVAPLKAADDAVTIDTSKLSLDEVVQKLRSLIEERMQDG